MTCVDGAGPEFLAHHWPHAALDYSTCPKYGPSSWDLSKMPTYLVPARTRTCATNVRPEWNCSLPSVSYCWRSFSSHISRFLSLLSLVPSRACSRDTSPWVPAAGLCVHAQSLWSSQFSATSWTVARQVPLSTGFSRQDWSGLPFSSPGDLPDRGIELRVSCIAGRFFTVWATREALLYCTAVLFKGRYYKIQNVYFCVCFLGVICVESIMNLLQWSTM